MSKSYHEQFRENQRDKNQNGLFSKSKATAGGKLPAQRSTAVVKQPLRSDTFTLPTKRDETNFKVPKLNQQQNGSRRQKAKEPVDFIKSLPPTEQKRIEPMRKNGGNRPVLKQPNSFMNRQNLERKPVRFANNYDNTYYSSSPASAPVYYEKTAPLTDPLPRDNLDKSRPMRVSNDEYVIHRRKDSPAYAYTDYQTVSNIPTISYATSLPPISQSTNPTAPTVIIRSKETRHSDSPTVIPYLSTVPSYSSTAPYMIFPSSTAPTNYPTSTTMLPSSYTHTYPPTTYLPSSAPPTSMFLPTSTIPSYYSNPTMTYPTTTTTGQPPVHTVLLPPASTPNYFSQPYFYPMSYSNPIPISSVPAPSQPPPPPPPPQQTIISQSSSSSVTNSAPIKIENKPEENNATIIVRPHTTNHNKKNVTIQLKMIDEDMPLDKRRSRVVRVVQDPPYREYDDDLYYVQSEPRRVIYEQPARRPAIIRKPLPATEYVYVDESPSNFVRHRPPRSEVVYIDNNHPLEYQEEIVYVDGNGNQIDYIYDDEPTYHRRNHKKSRQPTSTNIVYK